MKHGAFWETMHGKELRKEIPESTAPPKKKGDVVSLVGQDIPRSRLGTPQTDSVTRQPSDKDGFNTTATSAFQRLQESGDEDEGGEALFSEGGAGGTRGFDDGEERSVASKAAPPVRGALVARPRPAAAAPLDLAAQPTNKYGIHKQLHRLAPEELAQLSLTDDRNAHRAAMAAKRDQDARLRTNERPRDFDVLGRPRGRPVRLPQGKRGALHEDRAREEAEAAAQPEVSLATMAHLSAWGASHTAEGEAQQTAQRARDAAAEAAARRRKAPPIATKKGGGLNVRAGATHLFEVSPHALDVGTLALGATVRRQLTITNISEAPARFRVAAAAGGGGGPAGAAAGAGGARGGRPLANRVRAVNRPPQPVAAGMKVTLDVEVTGGVLGGLGAAVELVTEHEAIEVPVTGLVVDGGGGGGGGGSLGSASEAP